MDHNSDPPLHSRLRQDSMSTNSHNMSNHPFHASPPLTNQSSILQTVVTPTCSPSPSNSVDTDIEYFPSNLDSASANQVNRFTELAGVTPRHAKKHLHQYRNLVTGEILFDDAISAYFNSHDHEDDEEYVYGEDGCFCRDNATDLVLSEIIREVREELGREQGDEETLWYGVRERVVAMTKIGWMSYEKSGVPLIVIERVKGTVDLVLRGMDCQGPSLHEEIFMRPSKVKSPRERRYCRTRLKKPRNKTR